MTRPDRRADVREEEIQRLHISKWAGIPYRSRRRALDSYLRELFLELTAQNEERLGTVVLDPLQVRKGKKFGSAVVELLNIYESLERRRRPMSPWPDEDEARLLRRLEEQDPRRMAEVDGYVQAENSRELKTKLVYLRRDSENEALDE